jgi:hypothetical protein
VPGGHTRRIHNSGEASELLNTLEVKTVQRRYMEKRQNNGGSVELCQVGIEQVQVCMRKTLCQV